MNCAYLFSIQYQSNSVPVGWFTSLFGCSAMNSYPGHTCLFSLLTKLNCFPDKETKNMPNLYVHVVCKDILLCRLPIGCQQVTDSRPTVGQHFGLKHNANCWLSVGQLLADCWPTVGQQSADCRPIVGRQLADSIFWELFFTITTKWDPKAWLISCLISASLLGATDLLFTYHDQLSIAI